MRTVTPAGTAAWPERGLRLPPVGPSVPRARRYVREQLLAAVPDDVVDAAELCVSELATNSVLHAATEFVVELGRSGGAVRLAVSDRSSVLPRTVAYGTAAATGRGLQLVARLSAHWGVQALTGAGKTVWCEVVGCAPELDVDDVLAGWEDTLDDEPGAAPAAEQTPADRLPGLVVLLDYPVRRGMRAREHTDALLRECMLLRLAQPTAHHAPARLAELAELLASRYSAALTEPERCELEAFHRRESVVDLTYPLLPGTAAVVTAWRQALAEMDAFCRTEQLLTLATPPDVAELQAWVLGQFLAQADGRPPQPWSGPAD